MPVQLQPEIYRLIAKALSSWTGSIGTTAVNQNEPIQSSSILATSIKHRRQASLASLMRVSRTMYEICKTELYNDCLVADIDVFAQDIKSNPQKAALLAQTKTIRVYQGDQLLLKESTYAQFLSSDDEWRILGPRLTPDDDTGALRLSAKDIDFAFRFLSGPAFMALRSSVSKGAFANLERVTMTREYESYPWGSMQEEFYLFNEVLIPPPLPFFFVNLPSVKHYCQWSATGPLAIHNQTLKVDNPPKIFTIHNPAMHEEIGPTTNFMCSKSDSAEDIRYESVAPFLAPLEDMFAGIPVLQAQSDNCEVVSFESISLDNTRVEIYDYIRHCTFSGGSDIMTADRRPTDLSEIQSVLDERIGRWKGKVILKNREDCPPCSACGFAGYGMDD